MQFIETGGAHRHKDGKQDAPPVVVGSVFGKQDAPPVVVGSVLTEGPVEEPGEDEVLDYMRQLPDQKMGPSDRLSTDPRKEEL
jgi:hypothetical protein